jgi:multidrug efflux pump subunit AcrA (membrane-fusion protein)
VAGELATADSELDTLRVTMGAASSRTEEDRNRKKALSVRYKEVEARIESLRKQLDKLHEQESLLKVNSPIDGEVLTWNVEEKLRTRPVLRGQKLMEIAKTKGDWVLEMRVPEHDIGHVFHSQENIKEELDVRFILKTDPGREYEGTVEEIARAVDTDPTDGATVLVTVRFDASQIPNLRPGTQVIGKIRCGQRPLGYVWLHDLWDSIRQRVAF